MRHHQLAGFVTVWPNTKNDAHSTRKFACDSGNVPADCDLSHKLRYGLLSCCLFARYLETHPWKYAIAWLAGLSLFFFLSYGFANWATGLRHEVPSLVFGWEHRIPFVPWTIVPYWSTDLLYGLSLFLCASYEELRTHGRRLLAAQLLSVAGFLLFPLRFSFPVPHTEGLFGWLFAALRSFDHPYNQAPSLHLGLTVILWSEYSRHLRGVALFLLRAWMVLTAISTLTAYQHHFIDLPTGIWVGLLTVWLLPFEASKECVTANRDRFRLRIARRYGLGAAILVGLMAALQGAAWMLLWPVGSLVLMTFIYTSGRPDAFRKKSGRLPATVICLLGPYLVGAWLNLLWWTFRDSDSDEIAPGIRLGRLPRRAERDRRGVASIVDLAAELPLDISGVRYRSVAMLDQLPPELTQVRAAVEAINDLADSRPTLVCCRLGYSRSAAAVAAWLLAGGRADSVDDAIARIAARRPRIALRPSDRARLEEWRRT